MNIEDDNVRVEPRRPAQAGAKAAPVEGPERRRRPVRELHW